MLLKVYDFQSVVKVMKRVYPKAQERLSDGNDQGREGVGQWFME